MLLFWLFVYCLLCFFGVVILVWCIWYLKLFFVVNCFRNGKLMRLIDWSKWLVNLRLLLLNVKIKWSLLVLIECSWRRSVVCWLMKCMLIWDCLGLVEICWNMWGICWMIYLEWFLFWFYLCWWWLLLNSFFWWVILLL